MIRAAIFDVGGVILRSPWSEAIARFGARKGLDEQAFYDALFGGSDDLVLIGKVTAEEWWEGARARLGWSIEDHSEFDAFLEGHTECDRELTSFIESLRPGIGTALCSNAWSDGRAHFERHGIDRIVDHVIISAEVGSAKPGEEIYRLTLERLGSEPDEALFVDDSETNVEAARALGINVVRYRDTAQAIADCRALVGA